MADTRAQCFQCGMVECQCGYTPSWLGENCCAHARKEERERVLREIEKVALKYGAHYAHAAELRETIRRLREGA